MAKWPPAAKPRPEMPPVVALGAQSIDPSTRALDTVVESFRSTPMAVREAITGLCARVIGAGLDEMDGMTLEILLAEATNNVVEHAYGNDGSGWILLEMDVLSDWIVCRLSDGGAAMPDGSVPQPQRTSESASRGGEVSDLPEGGFGWSMIHELTTDLSYTREDDTNVLCFSLSVAPVPVATAPVH
ncbi:MAG: ATP-binding protein [Pseudomonadota bacterium]